MAIKVSELPTKAGSAIENNDNVLIVDPITKDIFTTAASDFRGASMFQSTLAPTTTPEDVSIPSYKDGDVFLQLTNDFVRLFIWNTNTGAWSPHGNINGSRILTSQDIVGNATLDDVTTIQYRHDNLREGDYYFNRKRQTIYGPYVSATGVDLSSQTYNTRQILRSARTFEFTGNDVTGYTTPVGYYTGGVNANSPHFAPVHGDRAWVKKPNTNGHGGFIWTFDEALYTSASGTHIEKVTAGWTSRAHYRKAQLVIDAGTPTQDDNAYRQGDSYFDSQNSIMYGVYTEDATPATPVNTLFDTVTSVKGASILHTSTAPARDDAIYEPGTFIISTSNSTPRLHGPYAAGESSDTSAWPLASVFRKSFNHEVVYTTDPIATYATDYPIVNDVLVVNGDTWTRVYSDTKKVTLIDGVQIDTDTNVLNWGTNTVNLHGSRVTNFSSAARPVRNDTLYYDGELARTTSGDVFGPYVSGSSTDEAAWPFYYSMAPIRQIKITKPFSYVLPTAASHADWGNIMLKVNDIVDVEVQGTVTGKFKRYVVVSISADIITWSAGEYLYAGRIYKGNNTGYPTRNDANFYPGDIAITGSGIAYSYVENQSNDTDAWVFAYYVRGPLTATTSQLSNFTPPTTQASAFAGGRLLIPGDILEVTMSGTTTNKKKQFKVGTVDHNNSTVVWQQPTNPSPSKTHNMSSDGQPVRNDIEYSAGDYALSADAIMFGPYVEFSDTNQGAWPQLANLQAEVTMQDDITSTRYRTLMSNGILYLEDIQS